MSKKAFEEKLATLDSVRTPAELRKALGDKNNYYVAKAAEIVHTLCQRELIPDLNQAFERFLLNPVKSDPQCWAKNAIAKALKDFEHNDASFYIRGMQHIQMEPSWGPPVDTAATLRGICAFALIKCSIPRADAMRYLVDLLAADKEKPARIDAAHAIAQLGGVEGALILRFKALAGDPEPEVIGQCFTGLLDLSPGDYIPFVAEFLWRDDDRRFEAAATLGQLPDLAAVNALTDHFARSTDAQIKRAILLSLGASRLEPAADFLMRVLAGGDVPEAVAAVRALGVSRFREDLLTRVRAVVTQRHERSIDDAFRKEFAG